MSYAKKTINKAPESGANRQLKVTNALLQRREQFALAAITGLLARDVIITEESYKVFAQMAVNQSNALIKELYGIDLSSIKPAEQEVEDGQE